MKEGNWQRENCGLRTSMERPKHSSGDGEPCGEPYDPCCGDSAEFPALLWKWCWTIITTTTSSQVTCTRHIKPCLLKYRSVVRLQAAATPAMASGHFHRTVVLICSIVLLPEPPRVTSLKSTQPLKTFHNFGDRLNFVHDPRGYKAVVHHLAQSYLENKDGKITDSRLKLNKVCFL